MNRLTLDRLRAVLPDIEELRPIRDRLLAESEADPARTWTVSGHLGTAGNRLVHAAELPAALERLATREDEHRRRIYALAATAITALADGDSAAAARTFLEAAAEEEARDAFPVAAAYADAAVRVVREVSEPHLASLALRRRGRHRRSCGRYAESERDYDEAFLVAEAAGDERGGAEALIGAGNVLEEQGRWGAAAERYRQALDLLDDIEEQAPERWHAHLNLHVVLRSTGALEESLAHLRRARTIAASLGDDSAGQFIENAEGQLRMARGDFEGAEKHLRRAVEVSTSVRVEIPFRLNLAETLLAMDRTLDAAEEARRAEREAILAGLPQKLPEVYRLLGRVAAAEGVADAFVLFERALEIIVERRLPDLERAQTLQAYAEAETLVGDPDASAELLSEADRLYAELGINRRRARWADRFDEDAGPADGTPAGEAP